MKHYIIPIFVPHKGCPHDCIFCNQKKITGQYKEITSNDVEDIIYEHLSTINKNESYIEVSFYGGSFTAIPLSQQNELLAVAKKFLEQGKIDAIRLSTRPDYINHDILNNLKSFGVKNIELGAQSMDDDVLKKLCRGHTSEDVKNASRLIKDYGFNLGLQMMIGLYGDTEEKDIKTAEEIIKLQPNFVRIYPTLVVKDTYLEVLYNNGFYKPLEIDEAVNISKKLYKMFVKNNIYIMRIGLQVSEDFTLGKNVVAGPFHPAFRELVESKLLNEMIESIIHNYFSETDIVNITVSNKTLSKIYSDKKKYFFDMLKQIDSKKIVIKQDNALETFEILFETDEKRKNMSLFEFISNEG
ncbi:MAG: radical SAM protein [Clostridiales bacterium]|nr:radical SAM protein [Clostridiales bacterium]